MNLVVGITGATGAVYGVRLLECLAEYKEIKTHLIISEFGSKTIQIETEYTLEYVKELADYVYDNNALDARISSGSFLTDGMVILPCSMKTLASIANGFCENLIARAADVTIKEGRRLVLCARETPLNAIALENMLKLSRIGVRIVPPMPAFYNKPKTIDDIISHSIMKILDQLGIQNQASQRWN
jgi:4-hydroxy-3-polyprenylbenzoate decarboxylase